MNITLRTIFINLLMLFIGLFLVYLVFRGQNLSIIFSELKKVKIIFLPFAILSIALSHYCRGLRWKQLIEPLGYFPSSLQTFKAIMIGYLANLALPRIGEITRCGILNRVTNAPVEKLIGTVIVERVWDLFSLILILALTFLIQIPILLHFVYYNFFQRLQTKLPSTLLILWLLFGLILISVFLILIWNKIKNRILNLVLVKFILKIGVGIIEGLKSFRGVKNKPQFFLLTFAIWAGYALATYILFFSVQATENLNFKAALLVLSVGSMGMIAPIQGGIGAYHWMVAQGLKIYGIPFTSGLVFATVDHSSGVFLNIVLGLLSLATFWKFGKINKS